MDKHSTTPKRGRGRTTQLDDAVAKRITDLVRAGNFPDVAAASCGIPRQTFVGWLMEGNRIRDRLKDPDNATLSEHRRRLVDLSAGVERAIAEAEARDVMLIGKHAEKDWKAAAFRLGKRSRARWGGESLEVTGAIGTFTTRDGEEAAAFIKAKLDAMGKRGPGST